MAERRPDPRRHREHRGDAGDDRNVERAPGRGTSLDLLAHRRRHGEHAGISARDHGDPGPACRRRECVPGARRLLTIVRRTAGLAGPDRHPIEIGAIAVDGVGIGEHHACFGGHQARVARPEPDDGETPVHGRGSQPGTSTTAKYGAVSSSFSASAITAAPFIVPRST